MMSGRPRPIEPGRVWSMKFCILASFVSFLIILCSEMKFAAGFNTTDFSYNFNKGFDNSSIICSGASSLSPQDHTLSGAICLAPATTSTPEISGQCNYNQSIKFGHDFSFSTMFSFNTLRFVQYTQGEGFTFFIGPGQWNGSAWKNDVVNGTEGYLGLLNSTLEDDPNNHFFAVEFDLVNQTEFSDPLYPHVGIDVESMISTQTAKPKFNITSYSSIEKIYVWIEYNGELQRVDVSLSMENKKPCKTLLSTTLIKPLSEVFQNRTIITGFSSSSGGALTKRNSQTTVWDWSFSTTGQAKDIYNGNQKCARKLSNRAIVAIIISILGVALVVAMILLLVFYRRARKFPQLKEENQNLIQQKEDLVIKMKQILREDDGAREFTYEELRMATNGFQHEIGRGGFGFVYHGELPNLGRVAVKQIKHTAGNTDDVKQLVAEVQVLGRVKHIHIVPLKGWCYDQGQMLLVYKYIENSDLDTHLFPKKEEAETLSWNKRVKILRGVAAALVFLHDEFESEEQVVHRDVKPTNVMLDSKFVPKLGDFGLARLFNRQGSLQDSGTIMGTPGYVPPEMATGGATVEADVYSYGVLALVVATGIRQLDKKIPGRDLVKWVRDLHDQDNIMAAADPKLTSMTKFSNQASQHKEMERVLILGLRCCLYDPTERPTMREVHTTMYAMSIMLSPTLPRQFPEPVTFDMGIDFEDISSDSERRSTTAHFELSDTDYLSSEPFSTTIHVR